MSHSANSASRSTATERRCLECGALCSVEAAHCWLCHADLTDESGTLHNPTAAVGARSVPATFSLATILLVITLIAVCLGVFRLSPGFGIAVICFAVPALVRTFVVGVRHKQVGQRLAIGDKLTAFAASLGIMVLVGIAGFVAFQIACWGTCGLITVASDSKMISDEGFMVSVVIGSAAALAIGIWIIWLTRPRRR